MHTKRGLQRHLPARVPNPQPNLICQASKVLHVQSYAGAVVPNQLHEGSDFRTLLQQAATISGA